MTTRDLAAHRRKQRAAARLLDDEVRAIRLEYSQGASRKTLATRYRVGLETIAKIIRRDTYQWVTEFEEPPLPETHIAQSERDIANDLADWLVEE